MNCINVQRLVQALSLQAGLCHGEVDKCDPGNSPVGSLSMIAFLVHRSSVGRDCDCQPNLSTDGTCKSWANKSLQTSATALIVLVSIISSNKLFFLSWQIFTCNRSWKVNLNHEMDNFWFLQIIQMSRKLCKISIPQHHPKVIQKLEICMIVGKKYHSMKSS